MARRRPTDEDALPGALAALETARDEGLVTMAGTQDAIDLAQDELERTHETLRDLPGIGQPHPTAPAEAG